MTTLISISDLHINSTVALCPPAVNLDDGGTYHYSDGQRWLWKRWLDFVERVRDIEGRKVLALCGDIGEIDAKDRGLQLVTRNKATVLRMMVEVLDPLLRVCDAYLVMRGTNAHTGKSAWLEEALAGDIGAIPASDGVFSHWHYRGVCDGVRLDIAHHASMGRLPWTKKNSALNLAARMTWEYMIDAEAKPPHIALRAHNHSFADSYDAHKVRVLYNGCWTLATEYSYRVAYENVLPDIGGYVIKCEDGKATVEKVQFVPDDKKGRRVWTKTL